MMKIKTTLATIATAITLMVATPATAQVTEGQQACLAAQELIGVVGEMRDDGVPPQQAVIGMVSIGVPLNTANVVAYFVYEHHGDKPVDVVKEIFLNNCLGESA